MPEEPVRIVEASTPGEVEDARRLFSEYAESLGWDISSGGFAEEVESLPGRYGPPEGALLLALVGDDAAGVLGLQPIPEEARIPLPGVERFGELKRLYVRLQYRRRGIGRMLMERAEQEARRRGYEQLVLTTSARLMPLAQRLYDHLGYEPGEPYRSDMPWPEIRWLRKPL